MNRIEKIIVPWDFSNHARAALRHAVNRFRGQAIKVICVLEPPNPYEPGFNFGPEAKDEAAERCRTEFRQQANIPSGASVEIKVAFGEPAEQICSYAAEVGADYIVISTHGRSGIQKLIMGSIAQKVTSQSRSPIILLPAKWYAKQSQDTSTESAEASNA